MKKINMYLGGSLFTEKDQTYLASIAEKIRTECAKNNFSIDLYVPQENSDINDKTKFADSVAIYDGDTARLMHTDIFIFSLDEDLGLAAEIGYYANKCQMYDGLLGKGPYMIGIYSDTRDMSIPHDSKKELYGNKNIAESQFSYYNLYVIGAIKKYGKLVRNSDEAVSAIIDRIKEL